jgi:hypothetical protein
MGRAPRMTAGIGALALLLSACSDEPVREPATAKTSVAASTDKSRTAGTPQKMPPGFKKVVRDGQEVFCRRELATGSRTEIVETCMTQAEYLERMEQDQDVLSRARGLASPGPTGSNPLGAAGGRPGF